MHIIIIVPSAPPETLYMSNADFVSRKLTFSWPRSTESDCVALLHYNIQASNCGSCPTTTNHTNVTCTEIPTNNSVCTFIIQTVVCGNITGQLSHPIRTILNPTSFGIHSSDSCRAFIISTSVLATLLSISIVVSITIIVIVIVIARRKAAKTQAGTGLDLQLTNRAEKSRGTDSMYDDVTGPLPSASAISTQDNVAYHHTHKQKN